MSLHEEIRNRVNQKTQIRNHMSSSQRKRRRRKKRWQSCPLRKSSEIQNNFCSRSHMHKPNVISTVTTWLWNNSRRTSLSLLRDDAGVTGPAGEQYQLSDHFLNSLCSSHRDVWIQPSYQHGSLTRTDFSCTEPFPTRYKRKKKHTQFYSIWVLS